MAPRHIAERYGLLTLIVLGETVAAATVAVRSGIDEHEALGALLPIAADGLLIIFAAWWVYFAVPIHGHLRSNRQSFLWGYGHYLIFVSGAAIGAGLEVAVEQAVGKTHLSALSASAAVTLPTALFLLTVWALHSRFYKVGIAQQSVLPGHGAAGGRLYVPGSMGGARGGAGRGAGGGSRGDADGARGEPGAREGRGRRRGARSVRTLAAAETWPARRTTAPVPCARLRLLNDGDTLFTPATGHPLGTPYLRPGVAGAAKWTASGSVCRWVRYFLVRRVAGVSAAA